jgi:hypothetical protein
MGELPQEMVHRLLAGLVPRAEIDTALGTMASASLILARHARIMQASHFVERHIRSSDICYHLRPTEAGEIAGQVKEVKEVKAG